MKVVPPQKETPKVANFALRERAGSMDFLETTHPFDDIGPSFSDHTLIDPQKMEEFDAYVQREFDSLQDEFNFNAKDEEIKAKDKEILALKQELATLRAKDKEILALKQELATLRANSHICV